MATAVVAAAQMSSCACTEIPFSALLTATVVSFTVRSMYHVTRQVKKLFQLRSGATNGARPPSDQQFLRPEVTGVVVRQSRRTWHERYHKRLRTQAN